jgi:uncharacterized protein DUF1329
MRPLQTSSKEGWCLVLLGIVALAFFITIIGSPTVYSADDTLVVPQARSDSQQYGARANSNPSLATSSEGSRGGEAFENGIPIDTKITMANWQLYEKFMPDGMIALFRGISFWQMPPDVEIDIGPTRAVPSPLGYPDATRRYGAETQMALLSNGNHDLRNYVAGMPFPNPADPGKGWKILADVWYGPLPRIAAGTPETGLSTLCQQDHFGNRRCLKTAYVFRMLSHIYTPGYRVTEPEGSGAWYTEWSMVESPEQLKYTTRLTIFWQDIQKPEDDYVFMPQLRQTRRLSASARCSPMFGTDYTRDDLRPGFNGGIALFDATWLRDQKILALTHMNRADGVYPDDYDMPLGFARPSWGQWEVRDAYVIDVRRISSKASGYCYGKRIMYVDKLLLHELWNDLYDPRMELWKVMQLAVAPKMIHGGESSVIGSRWSGLWDFQNQHATIAFTADGLSRDMVVDEEVPQEYENIARYSTPRGLMTVMR